MADFNLRTSQAQWQKLSLAARAYHRDRGRLRLGVRVRAGGPAQRAAPAGTAIRADSGSAIMLLIRAPSRSLAASSKRPAQMAAITTWTEALGRRMVVLKFEPLSPFILVLIHRVWSGPRASGPSAGPGSEDHGSAAAAVPPRLSEARGTAGLSCHCQWQSR